MIAGLKVGSELKRYHRSKMTRIAIFAISILPILYSTVYLWSFWNPFGNVNSLPVALVNDDRGTEIDGQRLDAGDQVVQGLLDDKSLNWQEVSNQEAIDGVRKGEYYFALRLPADFSEAVASPANAPGSPGAAETNPAPAKAVLEATYNDANGFLSTMIGENAMRLVLNVVSDQIGEQAVDRILVGIVNAGTQLIQAADGATELNEGITQLYDGSNTLVDGLTQAKDGTSQLVDGTTQLVDGTDQLVDGTGQLKDGSSQLAAGTGQLRTQVDAAIGTAERFAPSVETAIGYADDLERALDSAGAGVAATDQSVQRVREGANAITDVQAFKSSEVRQIADLIRPLPDPASQLAVAKLDALAAALDTEVLGPASQLHADINRLADASTKVNTQVNDPNSEVRSALDLVTDATGSLGGLQEKVTELQNGVHQLDDGAKALDAGLTRLADASTQLNDGAHQLNDGAVQLNQGSVQLLDGSKQLNSGLLEARDGSAQLAEGLNDGLEQAPTWDPQQRTDVASVMGGPVQVNSYNDAGSNTFGAGLAPFFFALSLYIGGIIIFFLMRPMQQRAVAAGMSPLRTAITSFVPTGLIGLLQATAVIGLTLLATPMEPGSVLGLFGFAFLVSMMYIAINQMFMAVLGMGPGRVAAMAFLIIQMVASGGLYPVETQPEILQWLHPFMPMTYAVNGFRQVLYGEFDYRMPVAILMVLAFWIGALLVLAVTANRDRVWTMRRLHPPIQV